MYLSCSSGCVDFQSPVDLKYNQYSNMEGIQKSGSCSRRNTKWTTQETEYLRKVVLEVHPKESVHWQAVTFKMREIGSNRSSSAYKARGSVYLEDLERIDIKHNKMILQLITKSFSQGLSSKNIKKLLGRIEITSQQIRNILAQRFSTIKLVVKKLVGASKLRVLKLQDYKVFAHMRGQGRIVSDLTEIYDSCKQWMKLRAKKYTQQRTLIEEKLILFHSTFKENAKEYEELDQKKMRTSHSNPSSNQASLKKDAEYNFSGNEDDSSNKELVSVFFQNNINWKTSECTMTEIDKKEIDWGNHKTVADLDSLGAPSEEQSISAENEPSFNNFLAEESHQNLFQGFEGYLMYEDSSLLC